MIISIINQKGGVGKTTAAEILINGLADRGFNVLGVDLEAQRNLTMNFEADTEKNVLQALREGQRRPYVQQLEACSFLAGTRELRQITNDDLKPDSLKKALQGIKGDYDYIVIDTPPALSVLTINALVASDSVIIPVAADTYSFEGVKDLAETIRAVQTAKNKAYRNDSLKVDGILFLRFNGRATLDRVIYDAMKETAEELGTKVYKTTIRQGQPIKEAQLLHRSVFKYAAGRKVTQDCVSFIDEFLTE